MRRSTVLLIALAITVVLSSPSIAVAASTDIQIEEISPSNLNARMRQSLVELLKTYDVEPFLFTKTIRIESRVMPHSHPVLTLHTFYVDKPDELLSVFLHEQLHWFVATRFKSLTAALSDLRQVYTELPERERQTPKAQQSTYLHLIVCWLELQSVRHYLGTETAHAVIRSQPNHRWVYDTILRDEGPLGTIVKQHGLLPSIFATNRENP